MAITTKQLPVYNLTWLEEHAIKLPLLYFLSEGTPLPEEHTAHKSQTSVLLSEVGIPMVFPLKNHYKASKTEALGFSVNTNAIDQNNFGAYPLFIFTESGIYAMEFGSGSTVVSRISPINTDVINNADSVATINGKTYYTTAEGLKFIVGQSSQKITQMLETAQQYQNPLGNPARSGTGKLAEIQIRYDQQDVLSQENNIYEFLKDCRIYFNTVENDICITNEIYPYTYYIHLPENENEKISIHKEAEQFYNLFGDYPNMYGTNKSGKIIYKISEEEDIGSAIAEKQNVFLQTNAFGLNTEEFEVMRRIIVRIHLDSMVGDDKLGVYLFVSNDTNKWKLVFQAEARSDNAPDGLQNFPPLDSGFAVKYGMLVIAGKMDVASDYLNGISVEWESRYKNKIR